MLATNSLSSFGSSANCQMAKRARRRSSSPSRADLTRLLDPSYLPHSHSSASSSPDSAHVYVDEDGEMHDPDYRDFPILAAPTTRRPTWESGFDYEHDDTAPLAPSRQLSPRERRRAYYDDAEYKPSPIYTPTFEPERKRKLRGLSPRRSAFVTEPETEPEYFDEHPWAHAFNDSEVVTPATVDDDYMPSDNHTEWTPTCGQQIRRKWQSVSLGVRFSVFRMQRRLKRKLGT